MRVDLHSFLNTNASIDHRQMHTFRPGERKKVEGGGQRGR